jgi:tetratricopeptide (TPR) repeat protein
MKDERVHGTTLLDITPTILTLLGLPVGRDMDGKAIVTAFEKPPKVEFIDSWEIVPGEAGMHPPEARADPFEAQEALRQLADLGYVNLPEGEVAQHVDVAVTESKFNLATSLVGCNQHEQAIPILRDLRASKPDQKQYAMCLAQALIGANQLDEALELLEETREPFGSADYWKLSYARVMFAKGKADEAMAMLKEAEAQVAPSASLQTEIAGMHEKLHQWDRAAAAFAKAIEIDPDYSPAHCGLGVIAIHEGKYEEAMDHLLRALALTHFYPRAHFNLAVALARLGWWERAIKAFEVCTQMYPRMIGAYRYLSVIHQRLGHPTEAMLYRQRWHDLVGQAKEAGITLNTDASAAPDLPERPTPEPAVEPLT